MDQAHVIRDLRHLIHSILGSIVSIACSAADTVLVSDKPKNLMIH